MFYDNSNAHPNGTILVPPGVWEEASHRVRTSNRASDDIRAAIIVMLNDLMDALGAFSSVQGAVNLAQAISDFSRNIEFSMGCVAVDLDVVGSGLQVASKSFATLDGSLATTFANLEAQMASFTTNTTLMTSTVPPYTPLHMNNVAHPQNGGGSTFFSQAWRDITNWGSDAYNGTVNGLKSIGAPTWIAVTVGGIVIGGYYVVAAGGGAIAAAG